MEKLNGYVEHIIYRNAENGYTVMELFGDQEEVTCVGTFPVISEGEYIEAEGEYISHKTYGEQFQVKQFEVKIPEDVVSIERYLGSGAIRGIGEALAARIVRRFKEDTFRIMEEEPERLAEIKGISDRKAREISEQIEETQGMRKAMLFLQKYGISTALAVKIYNHYGQEIYQVMKENPYRLADDVQGIGFRTADEIAFKAGILADSDHRIKSGILYVLQQSSLEGHVYLPKEMLIERTNALLQVNTDDLEKYLMDLSIEKRIIVKEAAEGWIIYTSRYYYLELSIARMLSDLNVKAGPGEAVLDQKLRQIEQSSEIELDEWQRSAVQEAVKNGLLVITGGPGTGKTTTINAIIKFFEEEGMDIFLAAPTGRAAKRMTETTGYEAKTIHRLLELTGVPEEGNADIRFEKNGTNPLEADVIIIDEMSMVDIHLMHALLSAVVVGTRLIMVGDVNQLPSVGPGSILKDIIDSHCFPVVKLTKIFRQASKSDIIVNAHKINAGEPVTADNKSEDFFLLKRQDPNQIIRVVIALIKEKLPPYVNATAYDIQVLTPMRKGIIGVEHLNEVLQQYLNPKDGDKVEKEGPKGLFREGDKVMQIKNNYQMEWEIRNQLGILVDQGMGIFNGDIGVIREINLFAETMVVKFDDERCVTYSFKQLDELELAYAVTIHKSQGSEYPAVVIPLLDGPRMLMHRNLLYTAVTRARKCVTLVGREEIFEMMIQNESEQKRYSSLCLRIREICGAAVTGKEAVD